MKVIVFSLGGSLIISNSTRTDFLLKLRTLLKKYYKNNKFVLVCGGGHIAREYIEVLKKEGKSQRELSSAGIRATRMNAEFVMQIFGKESNGKLPKTMKEVSDELKKNNVVICGSLRYADHETSDSTAAKLAHYLGADFVNLTNVPGLFTKDPRNHKDAKLISHISWEEFASIAKKIKYKPGQHFVLDQEAADLIKKNKIKTYILGKDLKNLENFLNKRKFIGTRIEND